MSSYDLTNMNIKKNAMIKALEKTMGIVSAACEIVDISRTTFYSWLKDDPEFKAKVDDVQEMQIDFAESQLLKNIKDQHETSIIFYLKTKGKKRGYVEKQEIDLSGQVDNKIIITVASEQDKQDIQDVLDLEE